MTKIHQTATERLIEISELSSSKLTIKWIFTNILPLETRDLRSILDKVNAKKNATMAIRDVRVKRGQNAIVTIEY